MTELPVPPRPRELDHALASRPDGEALGAVWDALPSAVSPAGVQRERDAAWARLQARLIDPARVPFSDDVPAPIGLVHDDGAPEYAERNSSSSEAVTNQYSNSLSQTSLPRWLIAACLVAAPTFGVAGWRAVPRSYEAPAVAVSGRATEATGIRLADGSTVWLAPGSRLEVPRALGWPGWLRANRRATRLEGRGFFAVARDGRPFTVNTGDAEVRVLGTRFEVRAANAAGGSQVTVEEGRVAVTPSGTPNASVTTAPVELRAGQRVIVGETATPSQVPQSRIAAWRTGGLAALDEPLAAVLDELARRAGIEITRGPGVNGAAAVSLFYPAMPSVDTVLTDLCLAQGLSYERTSRGYHLTTKLTRSGSRP